MVKFKILNREKSNPNPTQYKKKSSLGLLIMKNRILIQPNIKKSQVRIINHEQSNPNTIQYKKKSSLGL
jgi:hypothetical protein